VRVTFLAELVLPTFTVPKLRVVGETVTSPAPVPLRGTVCVPAVSEMVRVPETVPIAIGSNETVMVQIPAGATLPTQLFVWRNGAAVVTLETCNVAVPVFCNVTLAVPSEPKGVEKSRLVGVTETAGAVPTPVRATLCVVPALPESSVTVSDPFT